MAYKPYKKDFDYSYTLGAFPTLELLDHRPELVQQVYLHSAGEASEGVRKIAEKCQQLGIAAETNDRAVQRLSNKENCYAVGIFTKQEQPLEREKDHLILVNPSDMGNMGTIIRTVAGFGIRNVGIIRPGVDVYHPKVVRGSMGSLFQVRIQYFERFEQYEEEFQRNNNIYPFMLNGKLKLEQVETDTGQPFTIVFGNEGAGLSEEFASIGTSVVIPHSQAIDSLNLAVAVGIAAYHFTKRRFY